jgi:hypothetical protein
MKTQGLVWGVLLAVGCGPSIGENRMKSFPSKAANCDLKAIAALKMEDWMGGGEWEVIGTVSLSDESQSVSFSEKNKELVRPRVCSMGGEAISIQTLHAEGAMASTTTINYVVLRKRSPAGGAPAEQKF